MTGPGSASDPLSLSIVREGDVPVVIVAGELDLVTAPRLRDLLLAVLDDGDRRAVIDLSAAAFVDSSGLNAIVWSAQRFGEAGGSVSLRAPSPSVAKVLAVSGLDKVLPVEG